MLNRIFYTFSIWCAFFVVLLCSNLLWGSSLSDSTFVKLDRHVVSYDEDVTVKFQNPRDQTIWIFTSGCGLPDGGYLPNLLIEKKSENGWVAAGSPMCIAIATPPIVLSPGQSESVTFPVDTGLGDLAEEGRISGEDRFRYVFDIRSNVDSAGNSERSPEFTASKVPKHLRVSKPFRITGGI